MKRVLMLGVLSLTAIACQAPGERTPLPPLPEKVTALPYAELLTRARLQATQANEAFFVDRWPDLEEAAKGLEQTARFLARADDVPAKHRDTLSVASRDLGKDAAALRAAAAARDEKRANVALTRIQSKVRELRLAP
jgi:hypothetical protein